ncbi:DNA repair protein RadC [Rhodocyclaceae bacterium]
MRTATQPRTQRRAENALIKKALKVLEDRLEYERVSLASPGAVRDYLRLRLAEAEHEIFLVIWLDAQNRALEVEELFRGSLTQTSVYPREVVKSALRANAAAAILAHNHPSGCNEPSASDKALTESLKKALALVDILVLDHFVVGGAKTPFSFAERGLL